MGSEALDSSILETRVDYVFSDKSLLLRSLTHPSYTTGGQDESHNQRLEFLGDAVLGLIIAESLFNEFPNEREGPMTRYRSMLVKGRQLSELASEINLGEFLLMGEAEVAQGGRQRASILEDAFEAVIGAIYTDGGLEAARKTILHLYGPLEERLKDNLEEHNPKGKLQELLQPSMGNGSIDYRVAEESGPDHQKHFTVEVWIEGTCHGQGSGNSKKTAEEAAAREALVSLLEGK